MDDSRNNRRMRARSYDLRRKVLLKNFLKEQMAHVPGISTELFPLNGNSEDSSNSIEESSIDEVDELESSFTEIEDDDNTYSIQNSNNNDTELDNNHNEEIDVETVDNLDTSINRNKKQFSYSPSLIKFTGFFKKDSKSVSKPIVKPKRLGKNGKSPMTTRSFKKNFEKVFYGNKKTDEKFSSGQNRKNTSRSLFSLFKHRREQRHAKDDKKSLDNSVNTKSSLVSQSVQTDDSWVKVEMNKVNESNKRLKEENKLLSESLSYFMSNASASSTRQYNSQYQPSYENENSLMFHDYSLSNNGGSWNSNHKVSRSKSVHEYKERHKVLRNNYRTKSMNVPNNRNYFLSNSRPLLPSFNESGFIPRLRKKGILTNIPNSSSNRTIQRRSSMPERTLTENNRYVTHLRSNSMRNTHTRKPFYALSADAFY